MANILFKKIKDNALSIPQVQSLVGVNQAKQCRWIVYDDLQKFQTLEQVLSLGAVVILLQIEAPRAPKVGHFILMLDHGNHYEHFDSYGLNIDEELAITKEHHLTNLFRRSRKPIKENGKKLQTIREDINTCGRWVAARLLLRDTELDQFLKIIDYFNLNPDDMVAAMTILLQFKN